jgi:hypothetical protein
MINLFRVGRIKLWNVNELSKKKTVVFTSLNTYYSYEITQILYKKITSTEYIILLITYSLKLIYNVYIVQIQY